MLLPLILGVDFAHYMHPSRYDILAPSFSAAESRVLGLNDFAVQNYRRIAVGPFLVVRDRRRLI